MTYLPIINHGGAYRDILPASEFRENGSVNGRIIWNDSLLDDLGFSAEIPLSELDDSEIHNGIYAVNAIADFERILLGIDKTGSSFSDSLAVHLMGFYEDWGFRELHAYGPLNEIDHTEAGLRIKNYASTNRYGSIEGAKELIARVLAKRPFVQVTAHFLGERFDIGFGKRLGPKVDYTPVELTPYLCAIAPTQIENLSALQNFEHEDEFRGVRKTAYQLEDDKGTYVLIQEGEVVGINNKRGIQGTILRAREYDPDSPILAHKLGHEIDLRLADKILAEDFSGVNKRKKMRLS
ncbi:hypothetical protein HOC01_03915 [archaeon]|jgi:hypothetical protein|nr:hypothetical protein [archaeon]MBT6698442.1 hypothetical protein [archaeon]